MFHRVVADPSKDEDIIDVTGHLIPLKVGRGIYLDATGGLMRGGNECPDHPLPATCLDSSQTAPGMSSNPPWLKS